MTAIKINKTTPKKLSQISEPDEDELHFVRGFPLIGCNWRGLKTLGRMPTHEEKKKGEKQSFMVQRRVHYGYNTDREDDQRN